MNGQVVVCIRRPAAQRLAGLGRAFRRLVQPLDVHDPESRQQADAGEEGACGQGRQEPPAEYSEPVRVAGFGRDHPSEDIQEDAHRQYGPSLLQ